MIVFRADGNEYVGYGHVMRCLAMADAFVSYGEECIFVLADDKMQGRIKERGYETFILGSSYQDMEAECGTFCAFLSTRYVNLLIVDSYQVTDRYFQSLSGFAGRIAYVDDLVDHPFDVDILINYNVYAQESDYQKLYAAAGQPVPRLLVGTKYAPLRSEYEDVKRPEIAEKVTNICISTGGTDPIGLAKYLMSYLLQNKDKTLVETGYQFHFLIGNGNPDKEALLSMAKEESAIHTYCDLPEVKSLFSKCDLILSAAGSTLYEICALGIPCITYALADNQLQGNAAFEESGMMLSLGDVRQVTDIASKSFDMINDLAKDEAKRREISGKMRALVGGKGAKRIAAEIILPNLL